MVNNKIIDKYNTKCNKYFKYNIFDKYKIKFTDNNKINIMILNDKLWIKFKIICSFSNNKILWSNDMILIEKNLLSNIKQDKNIKNINNLEEYILEYITKNNYNDCLGIIKNNIDSTFIYYEIIKIIKS